MDELRNLTIIVPTLGAILISFICFIFNFSYNEIKNYFNPVIKEYSKVQGIVRSFLTIFYSVLLGFIFLTIIIFPFLDKTKNESIKNSGNTTVAIIWIIALGVMIIELKRLIEGFKKTLFNMSLSSKKKFIKKSIILIFLSAIFMILSLLSIDYIFGKNISINWNNNKVFTKTTMGAFKNNNDIKIYVNDKEYTLFNKEDKELASIKINVDHKNINFYVNKDFKISEGDYINLKENNKHIVKDRYKSYKKWIIICERTIVILLPILFIISISSMIFTLEKFYLATKYEIKCSKKRYIGEIWFEYDDFYLVRTGNNFEYVLKKKINELNRIEHRKDETEMNIYFRAKEFFKKSNININYLAVGTAVFIFIYEYWTYDTLLNLNKLNPFGRILIQLSYAYIGSYIFYILLVKKDENHNKKRSKKILKPMLEECVGVYKEFIEGFPNYEIQNKAWNKLEREELINLGKGINYKDEYKHCSIDYYFTEEEKKYVKTYSCFIKHLFLKILKQLEEVRVGLNILDEVIGEDVWNLIKEVKNVNKSIETKEDLDKDNRFGDLRNIMIYLFECHELIVKLDNDIKQVYGNEK